MKVLYLLRYYPTLTETFVYSEIRLAVARGADVTIAALGERADGALADELPRVDVLRVPRHGLPRPLTPGASWLRGYQRAKDVRRLPWLARRIGDFDRIHCHFAGEAAEWAHALYLDHGIPYTLLCHAVDLFKPRHSLFEVLGSAARVMVVTEHQRALLAGRGVEAAVVHCGPDLDRWPAVPLPDRGLHVLSVGRDVPKKGMDLLVDAWRRADVGGSLRLASDHDKGLGLVPPSRVRQLQARSNCFALACREAPDGDMDGVPLAMMEAMAMGRPVITTDIGGLPELVDDEVGWLVPPDDPDALADALKQAADPAERLARGGRARQRLVDRGYTLADQVSGVMSAWAG